MRAYVGFLERAGVRFTGKPEYIGATCRFDLHGTIEIGAGVVISEHVSILTHDYSISTGLRAANQRVAEPRSIVSDVVIGEGTFIGYGALILPGCRIGKNVIVGGGAVVRGYVPDGSVVIGNPATVVSQSCAWAKKRLSRKEGADVIARSGLKRTVVVQVMGW